MIAIIGLRKIEMTNEGAVASIGKLTILGAFRSVAEIMLMFGVKGL